MNGVNRHKTVMVLTLNIRARFRANPNSPGFSDEPGLFSFIPGAHHTSQGTGAFLLCLPTKPRTVLLYAPLRVAVRVVAMEEADHVTVLVQDGDIVVSVAGFYAVYFKPINQPQLILRRRTDTDDHALLARAWQAANDKAREMGWIVEPLRPSSSIPRASVHEARGGSALLWQRSQRRAKP